MVRCGTRSATTAATVIVPWTPRCNAMVLIGRSTAVLAMARSTVRRDLGSGIHPLWSRLTPSLPRCENGAEIAFLILIVIVIPFRTTVPKICQMPKTGEGCPRCAFAVYAAEMMVSKGRTWHKRCFTCTVCNRSLDSMNLNDSPDGGIYCRPCYNKNFGIRGLGFGMGAGALSCP